MASERDRRWREAMRPTSPLLPFSRSSPPPPPAPPRQPRPPLLPAAAVAIARAAASATPPSPIRTMTFASALATPTASPGNQMPSPSANYAGALAQTARSASAAARVELAGSTVTGEDARPHAFQLSMKPLARTGPPRTSRAMEVLYLCVVVLLVEPVLYVSVCKSKHMSRREGGGVASGREGREGGRRFVCMCMRVFLACVYVCASSQSACLSLLARLPNSGAEIQQKKWQATVAVCEIM